MCERAPQLSVDSKICDTCRKKLSREPPVFNAEPDSPSPETDEDELYVHSPEAASSLKKYLVELGKTPCSQIKPRRKKYSRQKVQKILEVMKHIVIPGEVTDE